MTIEQRLKEIELKRKAFEIDNPEEAAFANLPHNFSRTTLPPKLIGKK